MIAFAMSVGSVALFGVARASSSGKRGHRHGFLPHLQPAWYLVIALVILAVLCLRAAYIFHGRTLRVFPRGEIAVTSFIFFQRPQVEKDQGDPGSILFFKVRVTNRETTQAMNLVLDVAYITSLSKAGVTTGLRSRLLPSRDAKTLEALPSPLKVGPTDTVEGELTVGSYSNWPPGIEYGEDHKFSAGKGGQFVLNVHDYISGETVEFTIPGKWEA